MSGKHTPGPWSWSNAYETTDGRRTWSLVSEENGYGILSCDGEENSPQGINDEPNARLIAAAPELLEALQAAWNCICELPATQDRVEAAELVRNAIAKATGEA